MKFLYILSASVLLHQAAVRASYQATAGSCPNTYEAQAGDTCPSIATRFKTDTNSLEAWNPNFDCSSLAANDILCISAPYNLPSTAVSTATASATTSAAAIPTAHPHGMTITLNSEKDFCLFLPPKAGGDVASSGKYGYQWIKLANRCEHFLIWQNVSIFRKDSSYFLYIQAKERSWSQIVP
jgi:LysM domain